MELQDRPSLLTSASGWLSALHELELETSLTTLFWEFGAPTIINSPDAGSSADVQDPLRSLVLGTQTQLVVKRETKQGMLYVYKGVSHRAAASDGSGPHAPRRSSSGCRTGAVNLHTNPRLFADRVNQSELTSSFGNIYSTGDTCQCWASGDGPRGPYSRRLAYGISSRFLRDTQVPMTVPRSEMSRSTAKRHGVNILAATQACTTSNDVPAGGQSRHHGNHRGSGLSITNLLVPGRANLGCMA